MLMVDMPNRNIVQSEDGLFLAGGEKCGNCERAVPNLSVMADVSVNASAHNVPRSEI
jgi:hypothetical protein